MKENTTIQMLKLGALLLAAGTAIEAWVQGSRIFGESIPGTIATILFTGLIVVLFDKMAMRNITDLAQHITGQQRLGKGMVIVATAAVLSFAGSITFSLYSVPVIADVATGETNADEGIEQATSAAQKQYAAAMQEANAQIASIRSGLSDAIARQKTARQDAIKAQGGEFARLAASGNAWVWTSDAPFRKQRKNVEAAEAKARLDVEQARRELSMAEAAKARLIEKGAIDPGTAALIATQKSRFDNWLNNRQTSRSVTLVLTIGAAIIIVLSIALQIAKGHVEEVRTISDPVGDALENVHDGLVEAADVTGKAMSWARAKTVGLVAHPPARSVAPIARVIVAPTVAPEMHDTVAHKTTEVEAKENVKTVATRQQKTPRNMATHGATGKGSPADRLRRKIAQYKRRATAGMLSEKGQQTLMKMQAQYEKMKGK